MNQSKLEVITGSRRKAWENACEWVTIGFGFTTIQYNLFPPEVIPTVWLHTFAVSDD